MDIFDGFGSVGDWVAVILTMLALWLAWLAFRHSDAWDRWQGRGDDRRERTIEIARLNKEHGFFRKITVAFGRVILGAVVGGLLGFVWGVLTFGDVEGTAIMMVMPTLIGVFAFILFGAIGDALPK